MLTIFRTTPYLYFFDLVKCASYASVFEGCPTTQVMLVCHLSNELILTFSLIFNLSSCVRKILILLS